MCLSLCEFLLVCVCQFDRRCILPKSNQLRNYVVGFRLIAGPTKATFSRRRNIHHRLCSSLFKQFLLLRCDSTPGRDLLPTTSRPQQKTEERRRPFFPLCTNYLMCDLGALLPVLCSLWFILSFNLSHNLSATALTQSRCHSGELPDKAIPLGDGMKRHSLMDAARCCTPPQGWQGSV